MRNTMIVMGFLAAGFGLAACDGPPEGVSKDMTGPEGAVTASEDSDASPQAEANEDSHSETHTEDAASGARLESHEHGRATLAAAVDGAEITFSFEAPLASLVGFEHQPETDEQRTALSDLEEAFVIPGSMVSINSEARCLPLTTTSGRHMSGGHGALEVEHVYTCENPGRVQRIEFLMMGDYPALETIDAVFLSGTSQSAGEMTQTNPFLRVR